MEREEGRAKNRVPLILSERPLIGGARWRGSLA